MSTIQIKRGQSANIGKVTLGAGEPAFTLDTGKLYIGNGKDKVLINPDTPNLTLSKITDAGTAASKNVGTSAGQIPILDSSGKISASILPSITGAVSSVAGKIGVVTLTASDVGLGNVTNESKSTMFANAALTGTPTAPTTTTADNSTKIATTAYVKSQGYITVNDVIDGGTF